MQSRGLNAISRWFKAGMTLVLLLCLALPLCAAKPIQISALPAGNAITDGQSLLRYALPIDNPTVRQLQASLEDITTQLRANRRWSGVAKDISSASRVLEYKQADLLSSVPDRNKDVAATLIAQLKAAIPALQAAADVRDKDQVKTQQLEMLAWVGQLEEIMIDKFPINVPAEYSNLPQLQGRAKIEFTTTKGKMLAIVDGYSAPVTAGNFVDLVQRGFYDGLGFTRAEDSYVLQIGDPPGPEIGFIDPVTKKYRAVPLEVKVKGDKQPVYGITLEDAGRYLDEPVLPFSSFGALALARPSEDPNGGSSQFFFFLFEPELTPAGRNLLDGRYAVFGYVVEGQDVLDQLNASDKIESAKVVDGLNNLVQPSLA